MTITSASSYSYAGHNFQLPRIMILRISEYSRRSNAFASCDKTRENVESSNVDGAARQEQVERVRSIKERFHVGTFDFSRKNIATFHASMMAGLRFPRSTAHQMEFISASEQRGRVIVIYTYTFSPRFPRLIVERSSSRICQVEIVRMAEYARDTRWFSYCLYLPRSLTRLLPDRVFLEC